MNAGEGKTLSAAFPAVWHALTGTPVHVITANDYLAFRDSDLLYPVYNLLGVTSGHIQSYMDDEERRRIYSKDVVYSGVRELGFDFIRDNLKYTIESKVQKSLGVAIIDEIDHALIDESSIPMVISGNPIECDQDITQVKDVIVDMIDLQRQICRSLINQIHQSDPESQEGLLAHSALLLAAPRSEPLLDCSSQRPGLMKRIRYLAEDQYDVISSDLFYVVDPDNRFVSLSDKGYDFLVERLGSFYDKTEGDTYLEEILRDPSLTLLERRQTSDLIQLRLNESYNLANQIYQSLRAFLLLRKDVDYFLKEKSVVLIDRTTGRPRPDCIYQQGLQAAIESKEGFVPNTDSETLGQISVEGLIGKYQSISGMTGTAITSADEFARKYGLEVMVLPPASRSKRIDHGYGIYSSKAEKLLAVVDTLVYAHDVGLPVLGGTSTVESSVELSKLLHDQGIRHNLLNASQDFLEVEIIHKAGTAGAVTIATDMAGRGTDIVLEEGLDDYVVANYIEWIEKLLSEKGGILTVKCYSDLERDRIEIGLRNLHKFNISRCNKPNNNGLKVGLIDVVDKSDNGITIDFYLGLQVIATELHNSPRIDLQLNGRSGRLGLYGHTYTVLSLEDHLINTNADSVLGLTGNYCVDSRGNYRFFGPDVTKFISKIQDQADREGEFHRGLVHDYTSVIDMHTDMFYNLRDKIITDSSIEQYIGDAVLDTVGSLIYRNVPGIINSRYEDEFAHLCNELRLDYGVDGSVLFGEDLNSLRTELIKLLLGRSATIEFDMGTEQFIQLAKLNILRTADELWMDHLMELRNLISSNVLSNSYHKSTVAHYIQQAYGCWESFLTSVNEKSLSRLLTFPIDELYPIDEKKLIISDETRILIQQS